MNKQCMFYPCYLEHFHFKLMEENWEKGVFPQPMAVNTLQIRNSKDSLPLCICLLGLYNISEGEGGRGALVYPKVTVSFLFLLFIEG